MALDHNNALVFALSGGDKSDSASHAALRNMLLKHGNKKTKKQAL